MAVITRKKITKNIKRKKNNEPKRIKNLLCITRELQKHDKKFLKNTIFNGFR